jgi:uncharacterized protein YecE (DUF72 family)
MPVLVGTASWTDKTLIACGRFYPKDCKTAEARLRFYASQFGIVEVDSSYYAMPTPATAQLWAERTPNDFVMNVKSFRLFTGHQTSPTVLHRDIQRALPPSDRKNYYYRDFPVDLREELWRRFHEALMPLRSSGKLGLVHFQFPPWLVCNRDGHAHVSHCVERMAGLTVSVEFRHESWWQGNDRRAATLAFERELGVVHTVVDGPQGFTNSVPQVWEATHPEYALVRLHGRNVSTWDVQGATAASDRFNYDYPPEELGDLAQDIGKLHGVAPKTHVIFNNNLEDQGQRNAKSLIDILALTL